MLLETFDRLTRKDKYVWDVSLAYFKALQQSLTIGPDIWARAYFHTGINPCRTNSNTLLQSGDSPDIPLVEANSPPLEIRDRWKIVEKMTMITQYAFSGDYTGMNVNFLYINQKLSQVVEAIEKAVDDVGKYDAGKSSD